MAKYKLQENGVFDQENNMFIPNDPANRHWQEYQKWLAEGNQPDPIYTLDELKQHKKSEIKSAFQKAVSSGFMYSEILQADVNFGYEHLKNVENLIENMKSNNLTEIQFRIYDNSFVTATLEQLENLKFEMIRYEINLYQKKWDLEQQIDAAVSEEEINQINW